MFGRPNERAAVERALADARLGSSRVLVVRGEPGIGKTELLRHAAERAAEQGMEVLLARGVESEAEAPFGGLLELLRPALDELERISAPQAKALRSALDLGPTIERDRFVIGAATLSLLSTRSERRPLLVVVDDAHWLDDSSLTALLFAARRLLVDSVAVLFAARTGEARTLEAARLPDLVLEGVDADTAAKIVGREATTPPAPGVVEHLTRATGGNPLALVELATTAAELDLEPLEGPLQIETSVERAYGRRIAELPLAARRILALAATEDSGRLAAIGTAAEELGLELSDLEPSERCALVSISYGVLSWRHPLVRSAAYRAVSADERRGMHAALARALSHDSEIDRRAWHLAAAALGPDEAVAAALEGAGRRARSRSAYGAAATAAERAAQLTPDDGSRARRLFAAAEAAWLGGHADRALRTLEDALALMPEPRLLAELQHLRGQAVIRAGDIMAGHDILVAGASQIEALDPAKAVVMLAEATDACVYAGRADAMLAPARRARELLPEQAEERERFFASLALGTALVYNGEGEEGAREIRQAVSILEASDALSGDARSLSAAALGPLWLREAETGSALIDRAIESARTEGALGALPFALALAARHAATGDQWAIGRALYEEAIGLARETDQAMPLCAALASLASIQARQGEHETCQRSAHEAMALSERHGLGLFRLWALDALAELELGLGRSDAAVERLEEKQRLLDELAITDPDLSPAPELVEAGVRAGDGATADRRLEAFARRAQRKGQPWALARLERCRGLLADPADLERHFSEALRLHEATPDRFEEARTRLCYGECLRRARRRVQAREQLREALEAFDELGAAPWAERARSELLATGERARRRDPSTLDELTPQELQIGMALAAGHTTREAATKLFLSPKTVEYHLRNVYRKLAIHSREELTEQLSGRTGTEPILPSRGTRAARTEPSGGQPGQD
jgi:DNA-binding CsgD family transcriptional regulator